ncbi:unannotated protein [freshwater metagenome]|uniref:Unannotated protein n=1 Tax=freshwater metagenome TaxID=449393 RepID=A0A6J6KNC9_9ZZZZ
MRGAISALTTLCATVGPASKYTAPITASNASDKIDVFSLPPAAASPLPNMMQEPISKSTAISASAMAFTTLLRKSVNFPSGNSLCCVYTMSATTQPTIASPKNSNRSLDSNPSCSEIHERWRMAVANNASSANVCPTRRASACSGCVIGCSAPRISTRPCCNPPCP